MIDAFPHAEIIAAFGQTECSPITCLLRGEDAIRKIGSVGTPMLNVETRIVDDQMNDVPQGEVGEIVYLGPLVMKEYWNKEAETAEAFRGGWFHSGDLVRQDEDGYIYVVDRKKDMIISGGENIYCAEVENVLATHPKVADVALIGVPDPTWGETPLAVIVPRDPADPPTDAEIEAHCRRAPRPLQAPAPRRDRRCAAAQRRREGAQDPPAPGARRGRLLCRGTRPTLPFSTRRSARTSSAPRRHTPMRRRSSMSPAAGGGPTPS